MTDNSVLGDVMGHALALGFGSIFARDFLLRMRIVSVVWL